MSLLFYAVRHKSEYFRRRGYGGGGAQWVGELSRATIYAKRAQAVSRVTWWARYGGFTPELVRLVVTVDCVEAMGEHVAKALKKPTASERREVAYKKREFERAKAAYDAARGAKT